MLLVFLFLLCWPSGPVPSPAAGRRLCRKNSSILPEASKPAASVGVLGAWDLPATAPTPTVAAGSVSVPLPLEDA